MAFGALAYDPMTGLPIGAEEAAPDAAVAPSFGPGMGGGFGEALRRLTGTQFGQPRLQLWPEKMVRSAVTLPGDVAAGHEVLLPPGLRREDYTDIPRPQGPTEDSTALGRTMGWAPGSWQPNDPVYERAQDTAGMAGGGMMFGRMASPAAAVARPIVAMADSQATGAPLAALEQAAKATNDWRPGLNTEIVGKPPLAANRITDHPNFSIARDGNTYDAFVGKRRVGRTIVEPATTNPEALQAFGTAVNEPYRGRGVANAMYDEIERQTGKKMVPSTAQHEPGFQLWLRRDPEAFGRDYRIIRDKINGEEIETQFGPGKIRTVSSKGAIADLPNGRTAYVGQKEIDALLKRKGILYEDATLPGAPISALEHMSPSGQYTKLLDEVFAPAVNKTKLVDEQGLPIQGPAYTKEARAVLDDIAKGPKGAGPMDISLQAHVPEVPQVDLPRYVPPRGVSPRLQEAIESPAVQQGLRDSMEAGRGVANWYHTDPIRVEFVKELGPSLGQTEFKRFMDTVAATSPRSDVPTNIRNASYYYKQGADLPDKNPYPYGHVAQKLHRQNVETIGREAGWDPFQNPKPASFAENLRGNLEPVTVDTHAFRNIGMRTGDPRFLETQIQQKLPPGAERGPNSLVSRFGEIDEGKGVVRYRPQQLLKEGKLTMEEAQGIPTFWAAQPKANEYAAAEGFFKDAGKEAGLRPADAQAAAWAGGGELTGLGTVGTHTFPELMNERVLFTARMRGESPQKTLSDFIRGKATLLADSQAVGAPLSALENSLRIVRAGRNEALVHTNPSRSDVLRMAKDAPERQLRVAHDEAGNLYAWDAANGTHDDILKAAGVDPNFTDVWTMHNGRLASMYPKTEIPPKYRGWIKHESFDPTLLEDAAQAGAPVAALEHSATAKPYMDLLDQPAYKPTDVPETAAQAQAAAPARGDVTGGAGGGDAGLHQAAAEAARRAGAHQPLEGLPTKAMKIGDEYFVPGPIASVRDVAADYMANKPVPSYHKQPTKYHPLDEDHSRAIAKAFDEMKHDPDNPAVQASYKAMIDETKAQYQAIEKTGLKIEPIESGMPDPYAKNPRLAAKDVADNNHLWYFPTDAGFGSNPAAGIDMAKHPMMQPTGIKLGDRELLANDLFRIVHDYFGHLKEGYGFRAAGEDNAWRSHASMYSDLARPAMTTETRGQNSWVNYGPHGEKNRKASASDTVYADQKVGLLPEWTMRDRGSPEPIIAYHGSPYSFDKFDPNKIGAGEGNQAYGHGLYFAGHEPVSEWYRHQLSARRDPVLQQHGLTSQDGADIGMALATTKGDTAPLIAEMQKYAEDLRAEGRTDKATKNMIARAEAKVSYLKDPERSKGHMYQVAIDAAPEQFIDWDQPLHKQSPQVQKAVRSMEGYDRMQDTVEGRLPMGEKLNLGHLPGSFSPEGAARALKKVGIPGISYLDQGSRSMGKGTRNYVTFDAPRLLRKYALPGAVGFGSLAFKKED